MPPFKGDRYLPVNRISTNMAPPSPLAEQQSFKFDPSTVSSWPIAADLGCTQFK
jgi:hypothetical protein